MAKVECELMTQDAIDVEIDGAGVVLQDKSVDVEYNGTTVVKADDGFDGLKSVQINTNVPKRFECGDAYFAPPNSGDTSISLNGLLQKIDVSCWDTSNVTSFADLFRNCICLKSLNLSSWNTSSLTSIREIFRGCTSLISLDVIGWDTKKLNIAQGAFFGCQKLVSLDLSGWDASNIKNLDYVFHSCYLLRSLIGNKNLQDVESGTVALAGLKLSVSFQETIIYFSSILAIANGLADLTGATAQTLTISYSSYSYMCNDDDSIPTEEVIADRRARIAAICAAKNWNFAH